MTSRAERVNKPVTMVHEEDVFESAGGLRLFENRWLPNGPVKAALVIVHGITEHSGRYAELAETLVGGGFAVYAADLRGHGRSEGERIFVASFDEYLGDLDRLLERVRLREPGRPLFVLGHSMGGAIVALHTVNRPSELRGIVISGASIRIGDGVFPILRKLAGIVGRLFPRLRLVRLGTGPLSRDPTVIEDFRSDPLVFHGRMPSRTGAELLRAAARVRGQAEAVRLPLLVLHGGDDRLTDPAGSRDFYQRASSADKTLKVYQGLYHDVLHEPEKALVIADLVKWLQERAGEKEEG